MLICTDGPPVHVPLSSVTPDTITTGLTLERGWEAQAKILLILDYCLVLQNVYNAEMMVKAWATELVVLTWLLQNVDPASSEAIPLLSCILCCGSLSCWTVKFFFIFSCLVEVFRICAEIDY